MFELPRILVEVLGRIAEARRVDTAFRADIEHFNRLAGQLGADNYMSYARQIRQAAKLWPHRPSGWRQSRYCVTDPTLPDVVPGAAWLYLFHGSGKFRETALRRIPASMPSSFHLYALAYRQNDWAAEVRAVAREAFLRMDTKASALPLAIAALPLWVDTANWRRGKADTIRELLREPAVFHGAVLTLCRDQTARGLAALRQMLRFDDIDPWLVRLATEADAPAIRRMALTTLWRGEARILQGYDRAWIDKSLGATRRRPVFDTRPLTVVADVGPLCLAALDDRAVQVRAAALDGLMERGLTDLVSAEKLGEFADGGIYRLAWRADFILRQRAGT